uniref:Uncharacterized protein n=1 Tax=Medicago truncatula TaxID=3880 RepID=I3SNK0_MEDTR|nr:unknown [Medicago truncatula]
MCFWGLKFSHHQRVNLPFSHLRAFLRLYNLPFINIINGVKGRGRHFTVVTSLINWFAS